MCRNAVGALRQLFAGSVHHKPSVVLLAVTAAISMPASAFQFETGSDIQVRWDNTFKYSNAWRVGKRIGKLVADPTLDDGDRNFNRGLISNRLDLLSELDVAYKGTGFRVSGAAWYDDVYNRANDNDSPYTANSVSVKYNEFTHKTRELHGRNAEFLDAFVYSDFKLGKEIWGVARLGQHALLYGESLFFGNNSIAAGQQPIDGIRALSVPNSQFKELGLPVNQASAQLQLTPSLSVGAYYQFAWDRTRIPAAGSYFSPADLLDGGGERIVVAAVPGVGPVRSFYRAKDIEARDSGQGGVQIRHNSEALGTDFGFYAIRYHDKNFQVQVRPGAGVGPNAPVDKIGEYMLVFPEDIKAYGVSANRGIGNANVGFEASIRHNAPLVSRTVTDLSAVAPVGVGNNSSNPLYAVGHTAHVQANMINVLPTSDFWGSAALLGEIAWNRTLSITKNASMLDPNTTRDALAMRMVFTPTYFQVLDGMDLSIPMGIGYNIKGRSSAVGGFGQEKGGSFNIGIAGEYLKQYNFTLAYNHFFGPSDPTSINGIKTFKQTNKDRNFIGFSISRAL